MSQMKVFETSYAQIHEAFRALVKRAIKSGDIRKDLDPIDLLRVEPHLCESTQ